MITVTVQIGDRVSEIREEVESEDALNPDVDAIADTCFNVVLDSIEKVKLVRRGT